MTKIAHNADSRQRVVIAVTDSGSCESAFKFYMKNVHRTTNQIILAHSAPAPHIGVKTRDKTFTKGTQSAEVTSRRRDKVSQIYKNYVEHLKENNAHYSISAVEFKGHPGAAIVRIARAERADMIVIGDRGLTCLRRALEGSVSDYVTEHAPCPVILGQAPLPSTDSANSSN